ncbi:hypothetical protein P9239_08575 [Caballeronia sp. LZ062]|uniref:hypothetical protein n=1 Tax=unclassified Caballeronia TaxID=2646786 RepID=UPI0028617600|nr:MULTISPECIES: hypothetical protein [unclassified Caballeronia]MDR5870412.1 hypothetical protein [Caballeronia sp. LZ062]
MRAIRIGSLMGKALQRGQPEDAVKIAGKRFSAETSSKKNRKAAPKRYKLSSYKKHDANF